MTFGCIESGIHNRGLGKAVFVFVAIIIIRSGIRMKASAKGTGYFVGHQTGGQAAF
jgi:hypothetical protein